MGTNFYIRGHRYDDDPEFHIGKRSAAGLYCWDCGVSLKHGGETQVHTGRGEWYAVCPRCGHAPANEDFGEGAVGVELGFAKGSPHPKTGVRSASSFNWAMTDLGFSIKIGSAAPKCPSCGQPYPDPEKVIEDEYGRTYTLDEFRAVLSACPIRFHDSVGKYFS